MIIKNVEINKIDKRFENFRLNNPAKEKALYASLALEGQKEPLEGFDGIDDYFILLDGFKRLRIFEKLHYHKVDVSSYGNEEAISILSFLKTCNSRSLNILEQAKFIDRLHNQNRLTASKLNCSTAWVSTRLGILNEMSQTVKEAIYSGAFPARSYMYTLRPFTRVNKVNKSDLDDFVKIISKDKFSTREIHSAAHAFFRGGNQLKNEILNGNTRFVINKLKQKNIGEYIDEHALSELEKKLLRDFEILQNYMDKIIRGLTIIKSTSESFKTNINLLIEGTFNKYIIFEKTIKGVYYDKR